LLDLNCNVLVHGLMGNCLVQNILKPSIWIMIIGMAAHGHLIL